jgi:hypothetical protein
MNLHKVANCRGAARAAGSGAARGGGGQGVGGAGGGPGDLFIQIYVIAFAPLSDTPWYPWIATVIQGQTASIEGVSPRVD